MWGWEQNAQGYSKNQWNFERRCDVELNFNSNDLNKENKFVLQSGHYNWTPQKGIYIYISDGVIKIEL